MPPPGDESLGLYAATATQVRTDDGGLDDCALTEVVRSDAGLLVFEAAITRERSSGHTWLTIGGYSRDAGFDGQFLVSVAEATRVFSQCGNCQNRMVETFTAAVLSRSQADAVNGVCPDDALDGGIPTGNGITPPSQTDAGFDGARLCGVIVDEVVADGLTDGGGCPVECQHCTLRYQLRATRR